MLHKRLKRFLPMWLLIFAGLACSIGTQVKLADIPEQKDWEKVAAGENNLVDTVADELKKAAGQEGVSVEYQIYRVPDGKTWEDAKSFYTQQFRNHWTQDPGLNIPKNGKFSAIGWTRGGMFSEQAVIVAWVEDKDVKANFVIVILFSE